MVLFWLYKMTMLFLEEDTEIFRGRSLYHWQFALRKNFQLMKCDL